MIYILKGGYVVSPINGIEGKYDILVEDDRIKLISEVIDENEEHVVDDVINVEGLYILPGLVDAHCHLRTPGFEYKEDLETGSMSAAKGGFTSIACMPNTNPVIDNAALVEYIINKAKEEAYVHVYPIGSITKGSDGKELAEIGELKFAGAVAISDDGKPVENSDIMMKALSYASMFDIAVISHCEDNSLSDGSMNDGKISTKIGLKGIPAPAEEIMVARELILAEYLKVPVHIAHVSTKLSVDLVRNAKRRGVLVTCETCPHYFSLTEKALEDYDTYAKVNPPLRTDEDRLAIIEGIKDGTIDIIATDHAPHHEDEKNLEFELAANGLVGFETALPLVIDYLYHQNGISLAQIVKIMSKNPSDLLGLNKGILEDGVKADITVIDVNQKSKVDKSKLLSKSKKHAFWWIWIKGKR